MPNKPVADTMDVHRTLFPATPYAWFVLVAFTAFAFVTGVEIINALFVGYGEKPFLFT